ncbi:MAG: nif-specific transcriptional activator NifA [Pseudomonadota bacterium]
MIESAESAVFAYDDGSNREQRSLDALYEVGKLLASPGGTERKLLSVLRVLASFTGLRHGAVGLTESASGSIAAKSGGAATLRPLRIITSSERPGGGSIDAIPPPIVTSVLKTGIAAVIKDVRAELGAAALPEPVSTDATATLLAVPIRAGDVVPATVGIVAAYRVHQPSASQALAGDLRLLEMVAALLAQSLRTSAPAEAESVGAAPKRAVPPQRTARIADRFSIVGESPEIHAVHARIGKVAPTRATVLLRGESGTGKELFATAIHRASTRRDKPFVKVNCAALSESLLESELFGHEKGAFTGALERKKGRFELADGGTLFLDEIGDISPAFQAKLLRALQEGEFERVGGSSTIRVDVRLVTATNRDLEAAVLRGQFRADLYFRICVVPITLPPLRERRGDIPLLAQVFLDRFNRENGASLRFSAAALERLRGCTFPGNIRELENCVSRVATLASGPVIDLDDVSCVGDTCFSARLGQPEPTRISTAGLSDRPAASAPAAGTGGGDDASRASSTSEVAAAPTPPVARPAPTRAAREELIDAMERSGWVQAKAARLLGMTPRQIAYALKKHGIDVLKF